MSIPQLSTEQRVQQLESTVIGLLRQISELSRDLQSARTQLADLQPAVDTFEHMQQYLEDIMLHPTRLDDLETRVTEMDGGGSCQEDQQIDDSD
jgi:DNA repair ATPase RecN